MIHYGIIESFANPDLDRAAARDGVVETLYTALLCRAGRQVVNETDPNQFVRFR